jgi:hypothetical protein
VQELPITQKGKTWRVALSTRIVIGFLAVFMFVIAAVMFDVPFMVGGTDHSGDWIVDVAALVVTGFGVFAFFALVAALRTHLTLGATSLEGTVVEGHNRLLVPKFRSFRLALSDIRSVERRTEMFRTAGLTTMRDAVSLVTTAGERIGLFSDTLGSAQTMPVDDVSNAIAAAAGIAVTDDGTVRTKGSGLYGAASSTWTETPLDATSAIKARHTALFTAQFCTALLLLVFVLRVFL